MLYSALVFSIVTLVPLLKLQACTAINPCMHGQHHSTPWPCLTLLVFVLAIAS